MHPALRPQCLGHKVLQVAGAMKLSLVVLPSTQSTLVTPCVLLPAVRAEPHGRNGNELDE